MSKLEDLIAAHQKPGAGPISFKHAEDLLRQSKFDGPVTIHWRGGIPMRLEVGRPVSVELKEALPPAET